MSDDTPTTPDETTTAAAVLSELRAIGALLVEARTDPTGGLLDKEQVAALTALGESTVDRYRAAGLFGPADVRVGGALRWRRAEVLAWIAHPRPDGELMDRATWTPFWTERQRRHARDGN